MTRLLSSLRSYASQTLVILQINTQHTKWPISLTRKYAYHSVNA